EVDHVLAADELRLAIGTEALDLATERGAGTLADAGGEPAALVVGGQVADVAREAGQGLRHRPIRTVRRNTAAGIRIAGQHTEAIQRIPQRAKRQRGRQLPAVDRPALAVGLLAELTDVAAGQV